MIASCGPLLLPIRLHSGVLFQSPVSAYGSSHLFRNKVGSFALPAARFCGGPHAPKSAGCSDTFNWPPWEVLFEININVNICAVPPLPFLTAWRWSLPWPIANQRWWRTALQGGLKVLCCQLQSSNILDHRIGSFSPTWLRIWLTRVTVREEWRFWNALSSQNGLC